MRWPLTLAKRANFPGKVSVELEACTQGPQPIAKTLSVGIFAETVSSFTGALTLVAKGVQ